MVSLAGNPTWEDLAEVLLAGELLGNGRRNGARRNPSPMSPDSWSQLPGELVELFTLLQARSVDYVLVGGIALLKYIEGRNTQDIELVMSPAAMKSVPEIAVSSQDQDFAQGQFKNLNVDLLLTSNPVFKLLPTHYSTVQYFGTFSIPCATPEGLLLLKLYALPSLYRQSDMQRVALYEADITMLMDRVQPQMEPIFSVLDQHLDDGAMTEIRNIVTNIEKRIAHVRQRGPTPGPL